MANRRGRPSVSPDEDSVGVNVKMPSSMYDRVYDRASRDRVTIPEAIRRAVTTDLETQNNQK